MVNSRIDISVSDIMTKSGLSDAVEVLGGMVAEGFTLASLPGRFRLAYSTPKSAFSSVDPDPRRLHHTRCIAM